VHPSLRHLDHRPWPLPEGRWTWRQSWEELLFLHYRAAPAALQALVPAPLRIQTFEGEAFVGVVPFQMRRVMRRPFPDLPGFSAFAELNVRLYVEHGGRPGVYFLSLDATNPLVVWGGQTFFGLPYRNARIACADPSGLRSFRSQRLRGEGEPAFEVRSRVQGPSYRAAPGSLEAFLTERYCFYARSKGRLVRVEVHHQPWPLQRAEVEVVRNELLAPFGLSGEGTPLAHASPGVDVVSWHPVPAP
jgi:uncharacterized protein